MKQIFAIGGISVVLVLVALVALYLTSVYREGSPFPQGKLWTASVMPDPHVRLKIGDRVFDQTVAW